MKSEHNNLIITLALVRAQPSHEDKKKRKEKMFVDIVRSL